MGFHLDEPAFVEQSGYRDHRCRGLDIAEEISMCPSNLIPVSGADDEHPRAVDVFEFASQFFNRIAHDRQAGHGLIVGALSIGRRAVWKRRRGTRYFNAVADPYGTGEPILGFKRPAGQNSWTIHLSISFRCVTARSEFNLSFSR